MLQTRVIQRLLQIDFTPDGGFAGIRFGKVYDQTLQNVLLFIPFGFLLPQVKLGSLRWRCWKVTLFGLVASLVIEMIQLTTHLGWFDIDVSATKETV